jgi:hypothetical protein
MHTPSCSNFQFAKALRALALAKLNREEEANVAIDELRDGPALHDTALQAMAATCKESKCRTTTVWTSWLFPQRQYLQPKYVVLWRATH